MKTRSLIPFGLHVKSEQLLDVSSVHRGNACECICPSCATPLVAKQGEKNVWHFAHRSQNTHNETSKECDYSFAVSVRLMMRQLSDGSLKLKVPRYEGFLNAYSEYSFETKIFDYLVTDESIITLDSVEIGTVFSNVNVDILGFVCGVPLIVYVTYKDRPTPEELKTPKEKRSGVIEMNVNDLQRLFKKEKKGQYKEILRRYIEDETNGKAWIYHPRALRLKDTALAKREAWLLQESEKLYDSVICN